MLHKSLTNAVFWNAINVFLYKIILQTHQFCLFSVINKELFGISGTLFSAIYLLINLTNYGFDYSLFAFHRYYTTSRVTFRKILLQFKIRLLIVLVTTVTLLIVLNFFKNIPQLFFITQFLSPSLVFLLVIIFISESMKKSCELLANLSFLNKAITIIEIATLLAYVSIVWGSYFLRGHLDIYSLFIPMCITSCIELCIVMKRMAVFYYTLPEQKPIAFQPTTINILSNQACNYINQITKALFSPNFIIIFLAYHLGMIQAGYIKLIIDIIILLYMLLNRAVGIPSGAIMSQGTDLKNTDFPYFKTSFLKITNCYIQFLYVLIVFCSYIIVPCIIKTNCFNTILTFNIAFFALAGFLEYILITYEKLYLTQQASHVLALINTLGLLFIMPILYLSAEIPAAYLLIPFFLIRFCTGIIIGIVAYKIWDIVPTFKIHPKTILIIIIPTIIFLVWHLKSYSL